MKRILIAVFVLLLLATGFVAAGNRGIGPVVITKEGTQQIILRFGDVINETEPGLSWRVPFLDEVKTYERRLLYLNTEAGCDPDEGSGAHRGRQLRDVEDR